MGEVMFSLPGSTLSRPTYVDKDKDEDTLNEFQKHYANLVIFLQTIGLFYTAGIKFGYLDFIAEWTELLVIDTGSVSSIASFIILVGYNVALIGMLFFFIETLAKGDIRNQEDKESFLCTSLVLQGIFLFAVLVEGIRCGTIVYGGSFVVFFILLHAFSFENMENLFSKYQIPIAFPYNFHSFLSFLAIPITGTMMSAIVEPEDINESECFDNLSVIPVSVFVLPLSVMVCLLVLYHLIRADTFLDGKFPTESLEYWTFIGYAGFEIIERIITTIIALAGEEESALESDLLLKHLAIEYTITSVVSLFFCCYNDAKTNVLTIMPRILVCLMLWAGKYLNNFNICILEFEEILQNISLSNEKFFNLSDVDFSDCFALIDDDVVAADVEQIEIQRLNEKRFWPALWILIFALSIAGIWYIYLRPDKALLAWWRLRKNRGRKSFMTQDTETRAISRLLE